MVVKQFKSMIYDIGIKININIKILIKYIQKKADILYYYSLTMYINYPL